MGYEFEGVVYGRLRDMQAARRARYAELLKAGMNFTQAAHAVGVSKRTGKVWRNGRTRSTGRNERPLVDWYTGRMGPERDRQAGTRRHLSEDERIEIADLVQAGGGVRAIARRLGRSPRPSAASFGETPTRATASTGPGAPTRSPAREGRGPSRARSGPAPPCTTTWPPDRNTTGAPSRPAGACSSTSLIMRPCEHATGPSTCKARASCARTSPRRYAGDARPDGPETTVSAAGRASASRWS